MENKMEKKFTASLQRAPCISPVRTVAIYKVLRSNKAALKVFH